MKKTVLAIIAICAMGHFAAAQQSNYEKSIRLSVGHMWGKLDAGYSVINRGDLTNQVGVSNNFYLEAYPLAAKHVSFGAYLGGTLCEYAYPSTTTYTAIVNGISYGKETTPFLRYGIALSAHILPMAGIDSKYWDVELKGFVGSVYQKHITPQAEYSLGLGVAFYPLTHWGLFAESLWGKHVFNHEGIGLPELATGNSMVKCGFSYRF